MKAAVLGDDGLEIREVPTPAPEAHEILVRVRAGALNRADLIIAGGRAHGALGGAGTVMGLEWAGDVEAVGDAVEGLAPGDRVMCSGTAGWAEFAVCDHGRAMKIPHDGMSFEQAATLPVALSTMHDAIVTNGGLTAGQAVLIQGASSGVGLMGLRIARHLGAGLVVGSSTHAGRRGRLGEFGADLAVDSSDPGWVGQVLDATGGEGVDLIVDQISGPVANQNLRATRVRGRIVNVGRLGGFTGNFDFDLHAARRIAYIGVTFRTRTTDEVREIFRRMTADLGAAVADGTLTLPIDRSFPLDDAGAALAHMKANAHFGKIVLTV